MEGYRVYMCLSLLLIWMCWALGEKCHINPECSCSKYDGTSVTCDPTCGPNTPKFSASSVHFLLVIIRGTRDIKYIPDDSFQGLITDRLIIQSTGISEIPCTAWRYLKDTLTYLYLNNNYLTSVPACSLQLLSNLNTLTLESNNITVIMEDDFQSLASLQYLYIGNNKITEIPANCFNDLTSLWYLFMENNKITEIPFNSFKDLTSLRGLHLHGNQITQIDASTFRGLAALTNLYLSNNNLSGLHPKIFSGLKKLNYLDLDSNNITCVDSTLFQDLTNIGSLYLGNNMICRLPDSVFQENKKLWRLDLQGNCLTSFQGNFFPNNSNLKYLYLDNNHINSLSPKDLRNLPKLTDIYLRSNNLTKIDERIFRGSPNIRKVYLNRNEIHTLHAGAFRDLENLRELDISENKLKRFGPYTCSNCTRLSSLILSHNQISFMDETSLKGVTNLYDLRLDNNNLSSSSIDRVLKTVRTIRRLDLFHNPLNTVPLAVFNTVNFQRGLNLRNCNITTVPKRLANLTTESLDLSANNVESFGTISAPQNVSFNGYFRFLNISYNYLQSFNIILKSRYSYFVIVLCHNFLQNPITVTTSKQDVVISLLDLSYNRIQNVTQFPLTYFRFGDTQPQNLCNDSTLNVNTLNLSRNGISYISPEACLGIVSTLDLSYNRLNVFGELMPSHNYSWTRLHYLYMSGNNIHQVSSDALVGLKLLYTLDFRFNSIHSLQFTENKLKDPNLRNALFTGNLINCDCSSAWLRNGSIPNKLDSVRCRSPPSARGYLVYCYPVTDCPVQLEVFNTNDTRKLCEKDLPLDLSNLTVTSHESIAEVFWAKTRSGKISGYKLEFRELNSERVSKTLLIHREMSNTVVSKLQFQQSYNVCLSAQLHGKRASNEICNEVMISGVETFCAGLDVVIGLSVSLAVCLITAISLVVCVLCRRKKFHHTESSPEFGRPQVKQTETTGANLNMYQHAINPTGNQPNNEDLYEDLDVGQYQNSALEF